jgi:predicted permease
MEAVLNAALPVFALILAGYLTARFGILGTAATDSINRFVVYLALPALLFEAMATIAWRNLANGAFLAAFGGGMMIVFLACLLLERRAGRSLTDAGIDSLAAAYANTGFLGIPLCLVTFGRQSLPPVIIATLLTACLLFAIVIVLIEVDRHGSRDLGHALGKVSLTLLRNPLLVAPVLGMGFAATGLPLPAPVDRFAILLGNAASPCALVAIGLFLAQQRGGHDNRAVIRLVAVKLLVHPAITAVLAFWLFPMPLLWAQLAVVLAALPVGTGPFMLAKLYDREAAIASRAILLSTICSVVTVSLLIAWLAPPGH